MNSLLCNENLYYICLNPHLHLILQIFYTVDNPTNDWIGGKGYISKDMVVKGLPGPGDDTIILVSILS